MCIRDRCRLQGLNASDYYVTGGGITHLNGNQAVGFARIRYTSRGSEHSDYGRTSRPVSYTHLDVYKRQH